MSFWSIADEGERFSVRMAWAVWMDWNRMCAVGMFFLWDGWGIGEG
jgi:hypothetical protein